VEQAFLQCEIGPAEKVAMRQALEGFFELEGEREDETSELPFSPFFLNLNITKWNIDFQSYCSWTDSPVFQFRGEERPSLWGDSKIFNSPDLNFPVN
jgi:hypothetical protein